MIQIIAFSFNRAMQLDTLLSSLISHWETPDYQIDVIYNFSTDKFGEGYDKLKKDFEGKNVTLHRESVASKDKIRARDLCCLDNIVRLWRQPKLRNPKTDFRSLIIKILEETKAENVMFLTDDSMFVSDVVIPQTELDWVNKDPKNRQFSLRLGQGMSSLPSTVSRDGDYCAWDMYQNRGSWGYPFSVDAHIYNKKFALYLVKRYLFVNPNTFEMNVVGSVIRSRLLAKGRCFTDIKMLTFPINIVQTSVDNLSQNVSVEMLNDRYLNGEHLKYILDDEYNATKQYVSQIEFTDNNGQTTIIQISEKLIRPNSEPNEKDHQLEQKV